ncbi:MAG: heme exporter protein CcmD [Burkholderiaceae bacterium]|nr:heme exporter protein CcmD [Burkholderiaceae bacterium]
MHWSSWSAFWAMGGSASYVWGAYGMVAVAFAAEIALLRARWKRAREVARRGAEWSGSAGQP